MDVRTQLVSYSYSYDGNWSKIAKAIQNQETIPSIPIKESYLTILDKDYPEAFRKLRFPPWVLYYQGNLNLLKQPMITIIGSRKMTPYGKTMTMFISKTLATKYVIVSGLAKGVDGCAHETTILNHGKTIGIIGSGLDTEYPKGNAALYQEMKQNHLILSEYPRHVKVSKANFPWRNRLLAALGEKIIVTQASIHSGTMLTVNEAIALSKDIYCFPYPYGSEEGEGCNYLLQQGASMLYTHTQIQDFLDFSRKTCQNE